MFWLLMQPELEWLNNRIRGRKDARCTQSIMQSYGVLYPRKTVIASMAVKNVIKL